MSSETSRLVIRQALPAESAHVASVLAASAEALRARGELLWTSAEVSAEAIEQDVRGGLYYLGCDADGPAGVFRLQPEDQLFWPDIPAATSLFLHKLAVRPDKQGQGLAHALLRHALICTRQAGRRYLRLDCIGGRPKLRAVYESFGFKHHSDCKLGATVFHRFALEVRNEAASSSEAGEL